MAEAYASEAREGTVIDITPSRDTCIAYVAMFVGQVLEDVRKPRQFDDKELMRTLLDMALCLGSSCKTKEDVEALLNQFMREVK